MNLFVSLPQNKNKINFFISYIMKRISFYFLSIIVYFCIACSGNQTKDTAKTSSLEELSEAEAFSSFVERFHSDSVFAFSRISEEVIGTNTDEWVRDTLSNDTIDYVYNTDKVWTKDELRDELYLFKELRKDKKQYVTKYEKKDDSVNEVLYIPDSGFFLLIVFRLVDNKWYMKEYYVNNM